jgi:sterol desaturase/sphingolipid hydroxylase (fatty acid hydroxylase superfamily)
MSSLWYWPLLTVTIGLILYPLFNALQQALPTAFALYSGVAMGFLLYDTLHFYFHHGGDWLSWFPALQRLRTRHLNHHFKDLNNNFGVTSSLFDFIFGTAV